MLSSFFQQHNFREQDIGKVSQLCIVFFIIRPLKVGEVADLIKGKENTVLYSGQLVEPLASKKAVKSAYCTECLPNRA